MALAKDIPTPTEINRRTLLTAGAVTLVAPLAPIAAQAATETPVAALFREWQAAREVEEAAYAANEDEAEGHKVWAARVEVENRMLATPSQTHADWMLKVCAYSAFGESGAPDIMELPQLWAEARALVG